MGEILALLLTDPTVRTAVEQLVVEIIKKYLNEADFRAKLLAAGKMVSEAQTPKEAQDATHAVFDALNSKS